MEEEALTPTVKLRLYALEDEDNDEVLFALGWSKGGRNQSGVTMKGQNLRCPPGQPLLLEFKLKDHTDRDLEFFLDDPLWVKPGTDCPDAPCQDLVVEVHAKSSHKLTLINRANLGDYAYALQLVDEDGRKHLFDPVLINRSIL